MSAARRNIRFCETEAIGYAPCTPCSDGERVYVATAFYDIFCFDMDGKVVWKQYIDPSTLSGKGGFRASFFPSPMLYDDLLIRYWANDSVTAANTAPCPSTSRTTCSPSPGGISW